MSTWEWRAAIAYNSSHKYNAASFLPNSVLTQPFRNIPKEPGIPMHNKDSTPKTINGNQVNLNYIHSGEDRKVKEPAKGGYVSPGYYRVLEKDTASFLLVLERIGTDSHVILRHLDPEDLEKIKPDTVYNPGESIIPYPQKEFGTSGGIHGHIEETRIGENSSRDFVDPNTHS